MYNTRHLLPMPIVGHFNMLKHNFVSMGYARNSMSTMDKIM